jgi:type IV secretory pathway VirB2 component (pilin)
MKQNIALIAIIFAGCAGDTDYANVGRAVYGLCIILVAALTVYATVQGVRAVRDAWRDSR